MKKQFLATVLGCLLLGGVAFAASTNVDSEKGTISVSSNLIKEFAPNVAEVYFTVETTDKDMQKAISENKTSTTKAIEAVKKNIDTSRGEDIRTTSYNVYPQYVYVKDKQVFDKYKVSNTIVVKLKNIDNIGKIIAIATAHGVNRVENLNFTLENYTQTCNSLMSEAAQTSRTSAESIAKGLGLKIQGIKSINGSCRSENNTRTLYKSVLGNSEAAMTMDAAVPIEPGKLKIYANINAQFFAN